MPYNGPDEEALAGLDTLYARQGKEISLPQPQVVDSQDQRALADISKLYEEHPKQPKKRVPLTGGTPQDEAALASLEKLFEKYPEASDSD